MANGTPPPAPGASYDPRVDDVNMRVGRLEGEGKHWATKADVERVRVHMLTSLLGAGVPVLTALAIVGSPASGLHDSRRPLMLLRGRLRRKC